MTKFIGKVEPEMEVLSADGKMIGTVDHEDGSDRIKLKRGEGPHHYINWDWVDE